MVRQVSLITAWLGMVLTLVSSEALGQSARHPIKNETGVLTVDGTAYKTIDAAYADCPAAGCTIRLKAGVLPCPLTIITKPIVLVGAGPGGFIDPGSPTILANKSKTASCINIGLPTGHSLIGLTMRDFSIQGNRAVDGAITGDGISIVGGDSTTQIREVLIDNVVSRDSKGNGISIKENVFLLKINNSQFVRNSGHGISISNLGTGIPSQIGLSQVTSDLNAGDALNMNGRNVQDVSAFRSTFADSQNGVQVMAGSVNAIFGCQFCSFENNTNAGVLIKDGYGHSIMFSGFPADRHQQFGVYVDPPPGANFVANQIFLLGNTFGANVKKDVQFSANLHVGFVGPQAINQVGYTYLDSSSAAVIFDVFSSNARIFANQGFTPTVAGGSDLGSSALPWNELWLSGKASKYENIATVGGGLPAEYAQVDLTAQSTGIPVTKMYEVPAAKGGMYRVCFSSKETRAATVSSFLGGARGFQLVYTDKDDSVLVTTPATVRHNTTSANLALNTKQAQESGCLIINAKASTNIQYMYGYTSRGRTAMQFNLHIKLEAL